MSVQLKVIITSDGSHSLYHPDLRETYHSTHGAITESQHVFIQKGLVYRVAEGLKKLSVLEVGFGTGLNALLTMDFVRQHQELDITYHTLEPFPLPSELVSQLNYTDISDFEAEDFKALHSCAWDRPNDLLSNFHFLKIKNRLEEMPTNIFYDVVFFDAFAPNKQEEVWSSDLLVKVYEMMNPSGVYVTYCAQGQLKRDLKSIGFTVETLEGPPGKKEMTRAVK